MSDDETDHEGDHLVPKNMVHDLKHSSPVKDEKPLPKRPKESKNSLVPVELAKNVKKRPQSKESTATVDDMKVANNSKKRKFEATTEKVSIIPKTSTPSKRQRLGSSPARMLPKNRYGQGGRALDLAEVDFDEVPGSTRTSEPKASRMKDKTGKALPKPKNAPTNKVVEKKKRPDVKKKAQKCVETDADITLVEIKDKKTTLVSTSISERICNFAEAFEIDVPTTEEKKTFPQRASARASIVNMDFNSKPRKVVNNNDYKKPQKAPWERDDFIKQELSSGDIVDLEPDSKGSNQDEKRLGLPSDDITTEVSENIVYKEVRSLCWEISNLS